LEGAGCREIADVKKLRTYLSKLQEEKYMTEMELF